MNTENTSIEKKVNYLYKIYRYVIIICLVLICIFELFGYGHNFYFNHTKNDNSTVTKQIFALFQNITVLGNKLVELIENQVPEDKLIKILFRKANKNTGFMPNNHCINTSTLSTEHFYGLSEKKATIAKLLNERINVAIVWDQEAINMFRTIEKRFWCSMNKLWSFPAKDIDTITKELKKLRC